MENILKLLEFALQSFWYFIGCLIIFTICANLIIQIWARFWRYWTIRKQGYPPPHCDADGDFKVDEK